MRNSVLLVLLVLGGIVMTAPGKTKKEAPLPKLFCNARYAFVETYDGPPDPQIALQYPVDYNAAIGVQQRIQRWNRYILTYEQQNADLVFVVWKARPEDNRLPGQPTQMPPVGQPIPGQGTGPFPGQNPGPYPGQRPGQDPSSPQGGPGQNPGPMGPDGVGISQGGPGIASVPVNDQLAVYLPQNAENLQAPIWKKSEKDGLQEPHMPLFRKLADAVDDACPADPQ